ncbi:MAG TPA: hypothetical protein VIG64_09840, partial [Actinomycetota bacterium]
MRESVVHAPAVAGSRVTGRIVTGGAPFDLYFDLGDEAPSPSVEAFVVAALLPAMIAGDPLVVEAPIDAQLLDALDEIQAIFWSWRPRCRRIKIRAEPTEEREPKASGKGVFFSLGVDSFFTLSKKRAELTHLVMIKGYDFRTLDESVWKTMFANGRRVALETGLALVEVETNIRALQSAGWEWSHGPALVATGYSAASLLGSVIISASTTYRKLGPWGTHPLLDPMWSSRALVVDTFGAAPTRVEKMTELQDDDLVLDTLRVCLWDSGSDYNCGRCTKCVCMMIVLEAAQRLRRCKTLPDEIDPSALRKLDLTPGAVLFYFTQACA